MLWKKCKHSEVTRGRLQVSPIHPLTKWKWGVNGLFELNVKYLWPPLLPMSLFCSFNFLLIQLKLSHSRPPYGKFSNNIFWLFFFVIFFFFFVVSKVFCHWVVENNHPFFCTSLSVIPLTWEFHFLIILYLASSEIMLLCMSIQCICLFFLFFFL